MTEVYQVHLEQLVSQVPRVPQENLEKLALASLGQWDHQEQQASLEPRDTLDLQACLDPQVFQDLESQDCRG